MSKKENMSDYELQAEDFCRDFGVRIKICFKAYDKYFPEDAQKRNIYRVRIDRGGKTFSFDFGDSAYNTIKNIRPTKYDVLACLTKNDVGTLDDFIEDYGYEIKNTDDFKRIEKTYKAVVHEYENVVRLFSDCMGELSEIY